VNDRRKIIRLGLTVLGVSLVLFIAWYIYDHGFISIKTSDTLQERRYARVDTKLSTTTNSFSGTSTLARSGNYSLITRDKAGYTTLQEIVVPHFLKTTEVPSKTIKPQITPLARQSPVDVSMAGSTLVGYTNSGSIQPLLPSNITGDISGISQAPDFPSILQQVQVSPSIIGGIVESNGGVQPFFYDFTSSKSTYLPPVEKRERDISLKPFNGGFTLYSTGSKSITVYTPDSPTPQLVEVKNNKPISKYNGGPIYSYEKNTVAFVTGKDVIDGSDEADPIGDNNHEIVIQKSGKASTSIRTGNSLITKIALSPDSRYIFTQNAQSASIYDTKTKQVSFRIPIPVTQFIWKDSDTFTFITNEAGIFSGQVSKKTARNLVPYSTVRPTKISFISGDDVYFSGYTTKTDGNAQPDIYRASLSLTASSDELSALQNFPYQGNGFYVDRLGSTITVQLTHYLTDEGENTDDPVAKAAAETYIRSKIKDMNKYTIGYTYIDVDLRAENDYDASTD
jgi:hypothetical protein